MYKKETGLAKGLLQAEPSPDVTEGLIEDTISFASHTCGCKLFVIIRSLVFLGLQGCGHHAFACTEVGPRKC
jgi:hypothetical protein